MLRGPFFLVRAGNALASSGQTLHGSAESFFSICLYLIQSYVITQDCIINLFIDFPITFSIGANSADYTSLAHFFHNTSDISHAHSHLFRHPYVKHKTKDFLRIFGLIQCGTLRPHRPLSYCSSIFCSIAAMLKSSSPLFSV